MAEIPPPSYMAMPPRKKSSAGIVIGIIAACVLLGCICCGIGGYWLYSNGKPLVECQLNFKVAQESVQDYANQHDGKLPDADKWQDQVKALLSTRETSQKYRSFTLMKPDGQWGCSTGATTTGMAFNSDLSGKKIGDIKDPYTTPLLFEVPTPSQNAHEPYKEYPNKPTIMGKPRPWMVAYVQGEPTMPGSNVKVNATSGD